MSRQPWPRASGCWPLSGRTRTTPTMPIPSPSPHCARHGFDLSSRPITQRCCVCWPSATTTSGCSGSGRSVASEDERWCHHHRSVSTSVPNGSYTLQSVATDVNGISSTSAPITITVNNPAASTSVTIPSTGATRSGTAALLDATTSANVTKVSYEVSGGPLELERPGHRNGHRHALWLAGSVEHHHRAQRHLHAPERGLVRGWSRRYESRDLRHCCQLIESSRIWIKSEWGAART
jgi:hypothetical protein